MVTTKHELVSCSVFLDRTGRVRMMRVIEHADRQKEWRVGI